MLGKDKIQTAIDRYKQFETEDGYYLANSGGKDSIVIEALANMAKVKFSSNHNLTTVDPPELINFIRKYFPKTLIHYPNESMWNLIPRKLMPPTRIVRYCCSELKERGGEGKFCVTGVRWAESARRKNTRNIVEFDAYGSKAKNAIENRKIFLFSDNVEKRKMIESCIVKGKHILNPIVDWTEEEVWEFIKKYDLPYCDLYDQGFDRLGCIGCPMQGKHGMLRDFEKWPKYKINYLKAFGRMLEERKRKGLNEGKDWETPEDVFNWWVHSQ